MNKEVRSAIFLGTGGAVPGCPSGTTSGAAQLAEARQANSVKHSVKKHNCSGAHHPLLSAPTRRPLFATNAGYSYAPSSMGSRLRMAARQLPAWPG